MAEGDPIVAYDLRLGPEEGLRDRAESGAPLDLTLSLPEGPRPRQGILGPIAPPGGGGTAEWTDEGLRLTGEGTLVSTSESVERVATAVALSGELTLEAVVAPNDLAQEGPARIASISIDPFHRDVTLGQERDRYAVRLRTTQTDDNGFPNLEAPAGSVRAERQRVAVTFAQGVLRLFVDGEEVASDTRGGEPTNWEPTWALLLANEATRDRAWEGTLATVALWDRALGAEELRARWESDAGVLPEGSEP